jgi:hypothetical protein
MKKTTFPILIIALGLAVVSFLTFRISHGVSTANRVNTIQAVGMGDVQRYDSQNRVYQISTIRAWKAVGMGDLHSYEAQVPLSSAGRSNRTKAPGMGDLHAYEAQRTASP